MAAPSRRYRRSRRPRCDDRRRTRGWTAAAPDCPHASGSAAPHAQIATAWSIRASAVGADQSRVRDVRAGSLWSLAMMTGVPICVTENNSREKRHRQSHAAVRGRIPRQLAGVERDSRPRQAVHVRHRRVVVGAGPMVAVLLQNGEDPRGRTVALPSVEHVDTPMRMPFR